MSMPKTPTVEDLVTALDSDAVRHREMRALRLPRPGWLARILTLVVFALVMVLAITAILAAIAIDRLPEAVHAARLRAAQAPPLPPQQRLLDVETFAKVLEERSDHMRLHAARIRALAEAGRWSEVPAAAAAARTAEYREPPPEALADEAEALLILERPAEAQALLLTVRPPPGEGDLAQRVGMLAARAHLMLRRRPR